MERGPDGETTLYRFCNAAARQSSPSDGGSCSESTVADLEDANIVIERKSSSGKVDSNWQPDLAAFVYWYVRPAARCIAPLCSCTHSPSTAQACHEKQWSHGSRSK